MANFKPGFSSILEWWENVKSRIKELSIIHGVRRAREKRIKMQKLKDNYTSLDKDIVLQLLAGEEEKGAFIRSKEKFLENGEKPGYFYKNEQKNANNKFIEKIRNKDGQIVDGDDISDVFYNFFSDLYTSDNNVDSSLQDESTCLDLYILYMLFSLRVKIKTELY